ncbi:hypothetical protein K504DRAFT_525659 [Pleomassaria siparia CBS 279.74]|uniref:Uncharacterized protein n=1 Tax=Pleomassaria siparia CBS 279.74 TaxID=1314801 RepID=A0A6G1JPC1_9PLEO|nr:hypothetical protein K504DRAFT_525659 [Pleomassaria siparia CBS 279.74]
MAGKWEVKKLPAALAVDFTFTYSCLPLSSVTARRANEVYKTTLPLLLTLAYKEFSAASITEKEKFLTASKRADFLFASNARQAGARTNQAGGILVSVNRNGYKVWATVIRGANNLYACDLPCRALVKFVVVKDMSYVADTCAVLVTLLTSLNNIAHWEDSI